MLWNILLIFYEEYQTNLSLFMCKHITKAGSDMNTMQDTTWPCLVVPQHSPYKNHPYIISCVQLWFNNDTFFLVKYIFHQRKGFPYVNGAIAYCSGVRLQDVARKGKKYDFAFSFWIYTLHQTDFFVLMLLNHILLPNHTTYMIADSFDIISPKILIHI